MDMRVVHHTKNDGMLKFILLLLLPFTSLSQAKIPKKTNAIEITGISFKEITNALLDAGFIFDKIDSNYQTLKTEFKDGTDKNKSMKLRFMIRVKDSLATLTGEWYNTMFIGGKLFDQEQSIENSTYKIEYTYGNPKACFLEMNSFALSFKREVKYLMK
jgi:hypothetical protein